MLLVMQTHPVPPRPQQQEIPPPPTPALPTAAVTTPMAISQPSGQPSSVTVESDCGICQAQLIDQRLNMSHVGKVFCCTRDMAFKLLCYTGIATRAADKTKRCNWYISPRELLDHIAGFNPNPVFLGLLAEAIAAEPSAPMPLMKVEEASTKLELEPRQVHGLRLDGTLDAHKLRPDSESDWLFVREQVDALKANYDAGTIARPKTRAAKSRTAKSTTTPTAVAAPDAPASASPCRALMIVPQPEEGDAEKASEDIAQLSNDEPTAGSPEGPL